MKPYYCVVIVGGAQAGLLLFFLDLVILVKFTIIEKTNQKALSYDRRSRLKPIHPRL